MKKARAVYTPPEPSTPEYFTHKMIQVKENSATITRQFNAQFFAKTMNELHARTHAESAAVQGIAEHDVPPDLAEYEALQTPDFAEYEALQTPDFAEYDDLQARDNPGCKPSFALNWSEVKAEREKQKELTTRTEISDYLGKHSEESVASYRRNCKKYKPTSAQRSRAILSYSTCRIATAASIPFICPANCTSISMTCGGRSRQYSTASSPVLHECATSTAPVSSRPARSAGRSRSLSSTSSTLK